MCLCVLCCCGGGGGGGGFAALAIVECGGDVCRNKRTAAMRTSGDGRDTDKAAKSCPQWQWQCGVRTGAVAALGWLFL